LEPAVVHDGLVTLLPHKGSADLASWRRAEVVAELPAGERLEGGAVVRYWPWRQPEEGMTS
jgi:hypothetical protein